MNINWLKQVWYYFIIIIITIFHIIIIFPPYTFFAVINKKLLKIGKNIIANIDKLEKESE